MTEMYDFWTWKPPENHVDEQELPDLLDNIGDDPLTRCWMLIRVSGQGGGFSFWTKSKTGGLLRLDEEIVAVADVEWKGRKGEYYRAIQLIRDYYMDPPSGGQPAPGAREPSSSDSP